MSVYDPDDVRCPGFPVAAAVVERLAELIPDDAYVSGHVSWFLLQVFVLFGFLLLAEIT